jgi:hypothetical protein
MWFENKASTHPIHSIEYSDTERHIAMAITSTSLGMGVGNPMWIILKADKTTGNISCSIRTTLPAEFLPR